MALAPIAMLGLLDRGDPLDVGDLRGVLPQQPASHGDDRQRHRLSRHRRARRDLFDRRGLARLKHRLVNVVAPDDVDLVLLGSDPMQPLRDVGLDRGRRVRLHPGV